jgi:SAM-dependent MidA family methyltransferase
MGMRVCLYDEWMKSSTPAVLPEPTPEALAHSQRLVGHIHGEIMAAGGWISFTRYMELALYAPGLGYYAGGAAKFGAAGDFVTAPELTPFFGRTLARVAVEVLAQLGGGDILELGAGSGRLAMDVLLELECLNSLPARYRILEVSPDLRERQQRLLSQHAPHLLDRVDWLDGLPDVLQGVVLANEVLDALPVHLLHWTGAGVVERGVAWREEGFVWEGRPMGLRALASAAADLPVTAPYLSEINLAAPALIASLAARLENGLMLFLDYGFPRAEFYHPQRHLGTLKVHYRHHSLDDPFFLPGLADITAHVDFTVVAKAAEEAGLDLLAYGSQGRFLLDAGLLDLMSDMTPGTPDYLRAAQAVQKLVQPHEMGELFKVMALGRGIEAPTACRRIDRL